MMWYSWHHNLHFHMKYSSHRIIMHYTFMYLIEQIRSDSYYLAGGIENVNFLIYPPSTNWARRWLNIWLALSPAECVLGSLMWTFDHMLYSYQQNDKIITLIIHGEQIRILHEGTNVSQMIALTMVVASTFETSVNFYQLHGTTQKRQCIYSPPW